MAKECSVQHGKRLTQRGWIDPPVPFTNSEPRVSLRVIDRHILFELPLNGAVSLCVCVSTVGRCVCTSLISCACFGSEAKSGAKIENGSSSMPNRYVSKWMPVGPPPLLPTLFLGAPPPPAQPRMGDKNCGRTNVDTFLVCTVLLSLALPFTSAPSMCNPPPAPSAPSPSRSIALRCRIEGHPRAHDPADDQGRQKPRVAQAVGSQVGRR